MHVPGAPRLRRTRQPRRAGSRAAGGFVAPLLLGWWGIAAVTRPVAAGEVTLHEQHYDMGILPDGDLDPWQRLGGAPVLLLPDQTLLLNDNTGDDRVAYETLLGIPRAEHRVTLTARVRVISNLDGRGAVMEVSRPHLQAVLQLYPDHIVLVERVSTDTWRWLASADVDLTRFRELTLTKASSAEDPAETITVLVDGQTTLVGTPTGEDALEAGRLVIGSVTQPAIGASIWDWVAYRVSGVIERVPGQTRSFGELKSGYAPATAR